MNIWAKMMTALRGGVNEAGEAIVDSQALRILDQEVRDASEELKQSKNALAEIMAREKLAAEKCATLKKQVEEHEGYAVKALDKGDEALAHEVAQKIADLENQLSQETEASEGYAKSANDLRSAIVHTERNLKRLKQQVDTVKATENVQRAQAAVAERYSGSNSKMRTAMDSLERIKEKQALKSAQMNAASELSQETTDSSLQTKLEEAGIAPSGSSADEILARIKSKSSSSK
ncbi:MAG: PspA/IM30 family protein [Pseudomonadales bacterium]|nr:PspA/IM30 family protein [Pseudomonadales bacterium]